MGLQKRYPDINDETEPVEEPTPMEELIEPKKGRPKKDKKPRTPAQLKNDEKQRQRFKKEHESRKNTSVSSPKDEDIKPPTTINKAKSKKPTKIKQEMISTQAVNQDSPTDRDGIESENEIDEETVYIKRKPRKKTKRTYVIEPDSDSDSSESDEVPRRHIPTPRFSEDKDIFTLTFK